jgi:hypothetical protein
MARESKKVAKKATGKTTKKGSVKKASAKKTAPERPGLSPEQRYRRIEQAAYFLAESDGFQGDPVSYWIEAEKQLAAELGD